jgi:hypothetical protein
MISYEDKITDNQVVWVKVKWLKKEIGRIYKECGHFHYRPRGCEGKIRSEEFASLTALKRYLEGEE